MIANPLTQFQIRDLIPVFVEGVNLSFTNSALMMMIIVFFVMTIFLFLKFCKSYKTVNHKKLFHGIENHHLVHEAVHEEMNVKLIPKKTAVLSEILYEMIENMGIGIAGKKAQKFIPFIFTLYTFILLSNLLGMIPGAFTSTSHVAVTFGLAIVVFFGIMIIGLAYHGLRYFSILLPEGTPVVMMPLMFFIELFAYLARPISLSLRLAANMAAGHIILKVVASFVIMSGIFGFLPFALLVVLDGFEIFVAILQAYIFTILTCAYLNDALNLH